jgi:Glycosyltransferase family 87
MAKSSLTQTSKTRPLIVLAIVCLLLFELGVLMAGWQHSLKGNGDFSAFYRTAVMARSGQLHNLYDADTQVLFDRNVFPSLQRYPPYFFYHPPYEVPLLLPLAFLSYQGAFWLWTAFSFLLLVVSGYLLEFEFQELRRASGIPLALLILTCFPVIMIFLQGQDSALLLLLVALAFRQFERKRDVSCGVLLGLALFKFQFIIPLVVILAFRRRWKLVSAFLATAAATLGVSWMLVGTSGLRLYWQLLGNHTPEMVWRMANVRGLVESLGGPPTLSVALSLCLVLWCGLTVARMESGAFPLAILCAVLVSYHGHVYDYVLLVIPVLCAVEEALRKKSREYALWPALFFMMLPVYVLLIGWHATWMFALLFLTLAVTISRFRAKLSCVPARYREVLT